jgi:ABC-type phosphate transport system permease subunit
MQLILRPMGMYLKQYNKNNCNFIVLTFHILHVIESAPMEDQNMFSHNTKMILVVMVLNNISTLVYAIHTSVFVCDTNLHTD